MNNFVSLLHPASPAPLPDHAPKFPANVPRRLSGQGTAPFSSLLERAARPARNPAGVKSLASRPARSGTGEPEVRGERRESARKKNQSRERDEPQTTLAVACAVNCPPVKPQEPTQPETEANGENPTEAASAVSPEAETAATLTSETDSPNGITASGFGNAGTTVAAANATPKAFGAAADSLKPATPANLEPNTPIAAPGVPLGAEPPVATARGELDLVSVDPILPEDLSQPSSAKQLAATTGGHPTAHSLLAEMTSAATEVPGPTEVLLTPEAGRRPARAARRSGPEPLENSRGTGSAKLGETMKTVINKEDIAAPLGAGLQLLPGSPAVTLPPLPILPGDARPASAGLGAGSEGISPAAALNAIAKLSPAPTRADGAGAGVALEARPATALARIGDVISREVRMFKRGGDDLVEVVLTPDAKTQISLRLQWREGQVEVQARCDLGDHHALNVQWPQLQAALAPHGVRLSHLSERAPTGFTEFFNHPGFSQQSGGDRRSAAQSGGAEPTSPSAAPPAQSGPAKTGRRGNRRLESWA